MNRDFNDRTSHVGAYLNATHLSGFCSGWRLVRRSAKWLSSLCWTMTVGTPLGQLIRLVLLSHLFKRV